MGISVGEVFWLLIDDPAPHGQQYRNEREEISGKHAFINFLFSLLLIVDVMSLAASNSYFWDVYT